MIVVPLNQPKFCPTASWDSNAITFADQGIVGSAVHVIFVDVNNTIYVPHSGSRQILMWQNDDSTRTKIISSPSYSPSSIFVTVNGDIYIDSGFFHLSIHRYVPDLDSFFTVMRVNSSCHGLFIDIKHMLYCSMHDRSQVVKRSLLNISMPWIIAAGVGSEGRASHQLYYPNGIFVDTNFDLYVADTLNDRIQLFRSGHLDGITVVGNGSVNPTIFLEKTRSVVLDAHKYMFIVDTGNNRIVASGPQGFRCLFGCHGRGSRSTQLNRPVALSFDSFGNLFVVDSGNSRIQKISFIKKSCGKFPFLKKKPCRDLQMIKKRR